MNEKSPPPGLSKIARIFIVVLCLTAAAAFSYFRSYNRIVAAKNSVDQYIAQVEVVLQRRFDLIPNLVATVKGAAEHESSVLIEVTKLRGQFNNAKNPTERQSIADNLDSALAKLMVTVEAYPTLKADQNFATLQSQLEGSENRISIERQRQNMAVRDYNTLIASYPEKIVASLAGFDPYGLYFKADSGAEKAPKVSF